VPTSPDESARPPSHLAVESVTAGYGGEAIVRSVSIRVGRGEVVTCVGPNGAGKSTLLKAIVGVVPVSAGEVFLEGNRITNLSTDKVVEAGVGYVPQVRDVFEPLTVLENLEMGGYTLELARIAERCDHVIEIFPRLRPLLHRRAGQLSGGERKMLAIGRALMLEPSLLVLDEPTAGLTDSLSTVLLSEHILHLVKSRQVGILLVEQKATAALKVSDWSYVLASGALRHSGPAHELLERPDFSDIFFGVPVVEGATAANEPDMLQEATITNQRPGGPSEHPHLEPKSGSIDGPDTEAHPGPPVNRTPAVSPLDQGGSHGSEDAASAAQGIGQAARPLLSWRADFATSKTALRGRSTGR
jgi:ABC-type branched-subunit amino acid transport system ATPase component